MTQGSTIANQVASTGVGNSGVIKIATANLSLAQGSQVSTTTFGQGDAGSVIIHADAVYFDESFAFSQVAGIGKSSGIEIITSSLAVTNGSQLDSSTYGLGDAGSIKINASKTVSFDESFAFSQVGGTGEGQSGGIEITTGSLAVTNGAQISASTFGLGDAGSVKINARDTVSFDGFNERSPLAPSSVSTNVTSGAVGKGGNIDFHTTCIPLSTSVGN